MIILFTGVPGAGKTLRVVSELKKLRDTEEGSQRPIFTNISGLSDVLQCAVLEHPREWHKLPAGALVVIDECQRHFPPRGSGAAVPEYVQLFDTHRHGGLDVWLITQHPKLIDSFIRNLVGRHFHGYRPFGLSSAVWSRWEQVNDNPAAVTKPVTEKISYDQSIFGLYKSAEIHTHKRALPVKKLVALAFFAVAGLGSIGGALTWLAKFTGADRYVGITDDTPGAPASGAGLPAAGVRDLPELAYHGWQKFGDKIELMLCLPADAETGPGCSVDLSWSDVAAYEIRGTEIQILSPDGHRPLFALRDPQFFLDAVALGVKI
jgi:zona occludens toxin